MKKIAIIFIGSHFSGKSRTINEFLKKKLNIKKDAWTFKISEKKGCIHSQSPEESGRDPEEIIKKYAHCHFIVLAARPDNEQPSKLNAIRRSLGNHGFEIHEIFITKGDEENYRKHADEAYRLIINAAA